MEPDNDTPIWLTPRQERLVDAVVEGKADSKAELARIAGYATDDIPGSSLASQSAIQALRSINVQRAIQSRRESLAERAGIDAVKVLKRIESRAEDPTTPPATAQRADEYLGDVLNLREAQQGAIDARSLTINVSSDDVRDIARLIADG